MPVLYNKTLRTEESYKLSAFAANSVQVEDIRERNSLIFNPHEEFENKYNYRVSATVTRET